MLRKGTGSHVVQGVPGDGGAKAAASNAAPKPRGFNCMSLLRVLTIPASVVTMEEELAAKLRARAHTNR